MNRGSAFPRKRFGQHFLQDPGVIAAIVDAIRPTPGEWLIEIGPGEGVLTEALMAAGARVIAIEIDRDLAARLRQRFTEASVFRLIIADALRVDFSSLCEDSPIRVVGNLPYNVSTPLLFHLFEFAAQVSEMVFMLQREVVDRLCAEAGDPGYGRLSVMTRYHASAEALFDVHPESFYPPPRVMSSVVRLIPHVVAPVAVDSKRLAGLVMEAFMQRRKTLRNALRHRVDAALFEAAGIDPGARAETLTLEDFARLCSYLPSES